MSLAQGIIGRPGMLILLPAWEDRVLHISQRMQQKATGVHQDRSGLERNGAGVDEVLNVSGGVEAK